MKFQISTNGKQYKVIKCYGWRNKKHQMFPMFFHSKESAIKWIKEYHGTDAKIDLLGRDYFSLWTRI